MHPEFTYKNHLCGENVGIKEGTTGTRIVGNTFDGSGLTGANFDGSWVDVKGNDVLVENNKGSATTNNGYESHTQQSGWGCGTVFRSNTSDPRGATGDKQLAINVTNAGGSCGTTVYASNTVTGGKGLTNVPVTEQETSADTEKRARTPRVRARSTTYRTPEGSDQL